MYRVTTTSTNGEVLTSDYHDRAQAMKVVWFVRNKCKFFGARTIVTLEVV